MSTGFKNYIKFREICGLNMGKKANTTSDSFNLIQMIVQCIYSVYLWGFICIFKTSNDLFLKPVILKLSITLLDYWLKIMYTFCVCTPRTVFIIRFQYFAFLSSYILFSIFLKMPFITFSNIYLWIAEFTPCCVITAPVINCCDLIIS